MSAKKLFKWSVISYIIFVGTPFLLYPLISLLDKLYLFRGFSEFLEIPSLLTYFIWPYPFLLSLIAMKEWFDSNTAFVLADILGLIIVWYWNKAVIKKYA